MAEPFRIQRIGDSAVFEYDKPVPIPAGFRPMTGETTTNGPGAHPWVQTNQAARQGRMPTGETIGDAASRGAKIMTGLEPPSSLSETAASLAIPATLTAAGGLGAPMLAARLGAPAVVARVAPALGRIAASAGITGAKQAATGGDIAGPMALSAAEAALGEGLLKLAGTALRPLAKPANVLAEIKRRLGAGPDAAADVPLVDAWVKRIAAADEGARPIEVRKAIEFFKKEFGDDLADVFKSSVADAKVRVPVVGNGVPIPTGLSSVARSVQGATRSNVGRGSADTLLSQTPLGILAGKAAAERVMP